MARTGSRHSPYLTLLACIDTLCKWQLPLVKRPLLAWEEGGSTCVCWDSTGIMATPPPLSKHYSLGMTKHPKFQTSYPWGWPPPPHEISDLGVGGPIINFSVEVTFKFSQLRQEGGVFVCGLQPARITLWASTNWPSSQARVTSF